MSENQPNQDRLEGNEAEEFARNNLVQVVYDPVNWKGLHRNPITGEYWKEHYPQSELHGGGPPVFIRISADEAKREFNIEPE